MSLALIGKDASYEFRWLRWALLRDVVAAHDREIPRRLPHFLAIGDSISGNSRRVPAGELANELDTIRSLLRNRTLEDLVIGPPTAAVLYMGAQLSSPRPLTERERMQIAPIGRAATLDEYFGPMCDEIEWVCDHPFEDGAIEVVDG